ncbi:MAG TPA: ligand-gated channel protein [Porphyromonadaceae bacterium]|jgi:outer membrane cobalamin receptor|nr:ligand-gated channel protein [Porphyromonadaceae bacterium]HCM20939.1 ligand-gated channel protein [Porphyromonadaceae bacterium]
MNPSQSLGIRLTHIFFFFFFIQFLFAQQVRESAIRGTVKDKEGNPIEFATIYIKGESSGTQSDAKGNYYLPVTPGRRTFCVQFMGYETYERQVEVKPGEKVTIAVTLDERRYDLQEVVIQSKSGVQRVNETAYNVVALDATSRYNSTADLSDMLNKVSGVRIRETGGVGSDMQVMLDGFSGKHVKVFIDGVPQEGVGESFGLNNIPVNYAERIEVYKGVVPVVFGTDAIGGVINIVTKKNTKKWHLDASYSYGSFNTHKSYVNFGQTFNNGLTYEINAFQNYSDNSYYVDTPVEEFLSLKPGGGSKINSKKIERVKRFHDTYHNEAVIGKVGVVNKKWADRLLFGVTYAQMYKDIQTGVVQDVVFGGKYEKGHTVMPSMEYRKQDLLLEGLDVTFTANYNKGITHNVDTSSYEYNWYGIKRPLNMPGEQSYHHLRWNNNNWNGTFTVNYHIKDIHTFTFNNVMNSFYRSATSLLGPEAETYSIPNETQKNISGLSYRLMPGDKWNVAAFGKYYYQFVSGPLATSDRQDDFVKATRTVSTTGYGIAGTYFILKNLQSKLSYEKVYRLPSNREMFGDGDMESGDVSLKPENSHNINFNISFGETFGEHSFYAEGGVIYRDIKDYIYRVITGLGGGKSGATYINHGKVLTKGYTLTARYDFSNWLSLGGNFTEINTRNNVKTYANSDASNLTYGARMPNVPYLFANSDVTFYWHDFGRKDNMLTAVYDNFYVKSFPRFSEALGNQAESEFVVPTQFSHNVSVSYSMQGGRYNLSFECQNITDAKLYDNFKLQKAGRAFYGKVRISL